MALTPGTRLGPYEVTAQIGVGGMGEVYQATDTNLKRQVAIKVLPAAVAADAQRLARFQREAEVLASLNHPHIAHIHGLEKSDGTIALVMELVEGPTLADRIFQGAIPLDEALLIAKQIAEALEAAHEQGIIHRDLKPANIKVREDGTVKVLDFGLAKAMEPVGNPPNVSQSPTITTPAMMTGVGVILGTAAYMSPEQAKGRPADKRSDVWAFGCVLYEMLTGVSAFHADDVAETLAAILRSEPNWNLIAPRPLLKLVQRCLAKDSRRRQQAIGDVRLELEEIASTTSGTAGDTAESTQPRRRSILWAGIAIVAAVVAGVAGWLLHTSTPDQRLYRTTILTPGSFINVQSGRIALSPDGQQIAFAALDNTGHPFIWVRRLDETLPHVVPGTEAGNGPFWSPDSRYLAFVAAGKLKKVAVAGGAPLELASAIPGVPGSWNRDDVILFTPLANAPLHKISAAGGMATPVTHLDEHAGETGHRLPVFLPDGRRFLYLATHFSQPAGVFLASLTDPTQRRIAGIDSNVAYGSNALLYLRGETLVAQPLDADRATLIGAPTILADQVQVNLGVRVGAFSISQIGQLAYQAGSVMDRRLVIVDSNGHEERVLVTRRNANDVQVSPSGAFAAASLASDVSARTRDIWLMDLRGEENRRLTDGINAVSPVWSPDEKRLLFSSNRNGHFDLYAQNTSGPSREELFLSDAGSKYPLDWSRSGMILYARVPPDGSGTEIWSMPADNTSHPTKLAETPFVLATAKFSPDGRSIVYSAGSGGTSEVYVMTFPALQKHQISTDGGSAPRWSRDGKQIFFVSNQHLVTVSFDAQDFSARTPKTLFKVRLAGGIRDPYDVMPDSRRFVMQDALDEDEPITLLVNWPMLLQRPRR